MGIEIVEGRDLVTQGSDGRLHEDDQGSQARGRDLPPHRRRLPRPAGVPARFACWVCRASSTPTATASVSLANSIGTGVADDKVMYYFVPRMIKFYLGEDPILPNVETYLSSEEADRKYILENLENLVVKSRQRERRLRHAHRHAGQQGGDREAFRQLIIANPRNFIAQPVVALSRSPSYCERGVGRPAHRPAAVHPLRRKDHDHPRRPDARGDEAKARWWSTPRRAAGARILGCWRSE